MSSASTGSPRRFAPSILIFLAFAFANSSVVWSKPNVLFISLDDQNDWVGCLGGHPQAKTPCIDGLAAEGTLFANAHCQAPMCNPSRTSVMTGLRPSTTGIYGLTPWFRDLPKWANLVSLPQHLSRNGYHTYLAGKSYHGDYGRTPGEEFDVIGPPISAAPWPKKRLVDSPAKTPWIDWGCFPHCDEDKGDWKVASWAVDQLHAKPKEPFFLSVGFLSPHVPCFATEKWFAMHPEESIQLPPVKRDDRDDTPRFSWYMHWKLPEPRLKYLEESNQWKNLVRSYLACSSFVDSQVGRILEALDANGFTKNTIIVLWSDHGWHLGEKLITGKTSLWERSTRVPLIIAGPGIVKGAKCNRPVELLDLYPTLIDECNLAYVDHLQGQSLSLLLRDAHAIRHKPSITTHNPDNHSVRSERWRYIVYADGSEELYDMQADPNEWSNLANQAAYSTVIEEHQHWLPSSNAPLAPGSRHRVLTYINGQPNWEGEDINPTDPVPGI